MRGSLHTALSPLFEAAILLVVGFVIFDAPSYSAAWGISDVAVAAVVWTFRAGGVVFLLVAALYWASPLYSLVADSAASLLVGSVFALGGAVLVVTGNITGLLILLFGVMSLCYGFERWAGYREIAAHAAPAAAQESPPAPDVERIQDRTAALKRVLAGKRQEDHPAETPPQQTMKAAAPAVTEKSAPDVLKQTVSVAEQSAPRIGKPLELAKSAPAVEPAAATAKPTRGRARAASASPARREPRTKPAPPAVTPEAPSAAVSPEPPAPAPLAPLESPPVPLAPPEPPPEGFLAELGRDGPP